MSKPAPSPLPDLDDGEYAAKLRPLGDALIPRRGQALTRMSSHPDTQSVGPPDVRTSGGTETRWSGSADAQRPDYMRSRVSIAEHIEHIERIRGPKRRFEFLIPVRVGEALAKDAAGRGQSAATRLLEVLRDAGYPVIPEDFVDLRKEKGRV